jgi:hypothetical protein
MGKAYKCDRCGYYGTATPKARLEDYDGGFGTKPSVARRGEHWLCVSCYNDFEDFMDGE